MDLTAARGRPYARSMSYTERITIEPGKRGGQPCIRGLRITVQDVLEYLASGMTEEEILRDFPDLERKDIRACLEYAADRERRIMARPIPLPPPGFDELSTEEKVEYVQSLWDRIAANEEEVPVPEWHREVIRQRLRDVEAQPDDTVEWRDLRDELQRELRERKPEG